MDSKPVPVHVRDLARLRRVRDRIGRDCAIRDPAGNPLRVQEWR